MDHDEAADFSREICAALARGVTVFPTSFDTTLKLRTLLQSDGHSMLDVTRLLQKDPLLAAKIVQAANSVALNPHGPRVGDLRAAVTRLGLVTVRTMALSLAMRQFLAYKEMARFAHMTEPMIVRSREIAACALIVAREHSRLSPDVAMFAGLIHDLGAFYLLYRLSGRAGPAVDEHRVEHLLYQWCSEVGSAVLAALDVPPAIRDAIARHREPRPVETIRTLDELLYVCKLLVNHRAGGGAAILDADEVEMVSDFPLYLATLEQRQQELDALGALF